MADWNAQDFANFYSVRLRDGSNNRVSYGRQYAESVTRPAYQMWRDRITSMVNRSLLTPSQDVLVVGCGFGYLMAMMLEAGATLTRIWGADTSPYIQNNKVTEIPNAYPLLGANILSVDITDPNALDLIQAATGINNLTFDWVICEQVTETISAIDRPNWYASCEALLSKRGQTIDGNVAHIVKTPQDARPMPPIWGDYNWTWQSLSAWASEAPTHYWFDSSTLELQGGV